MSCLPKQQSGSGVRCRGRRGARVAASSAVDPLLLRVARGEQGDRPPVWLMRQAGRYMAEFREYSNKYGFRHRSETADIAIEAGAYTRSLLSST